MGAVLRFTVGIRLDTRWAIRLPDPDAYVHNVFSNPPDGNYDGRRPIRQDEIPFDVTATYIANGIYFDTDVTAMQFQAGYDNRPWERVWATVRRGNDWLAAN